MDSFFLGELLEFYVLKSDRYVAELHSQALPLLTTGDMLQFIQLRQSIGENALVKQFRRSLGEQL